MSNQAIVAVLRRVTPIGGQVDTVTRVFNEGQTLTELLQWAEDRCKGCAMLSLEVCRDDNTD